MLLRQTLLYLPAQVLGPLAQVVSVLAWTHVLSPDELGLFALLTAAQELGFSLLLLWFSLYTVRYLDTSAEPAEQARFRATEGAIFTAAMSTTAAALVLLPIGASGHLEGFDLLAALAFVLTRSAVSYFSERARAANDTLAYTVLQTSGPVGGLVLGLAAAALFPATAATIMWCYAIAQGVSAAHALARHPIGLDLHRADIAIVRHAVSYGLPLVVGGLAIWVANNAIRFLVEWRDGLAAVGLLTVGWGLGLRASQFAAMLTTAAAFPLAVRRFRESGAAAGQAQLERNAVLLLAVLAPALVGLLAIARPAIELFVAEPYRAVTNDVLPLAVLAGGLRNFRVHGPNQVWLLNERPMPSVVIDGVDAVLTVLFGAIGLWLGGMTGLVAGVAVSAVVSLAIALVAAWRDYRYALSVSDIVKISSAIAAMALAVRLWAPSASLVALAVAVALGAAVYVAVLAALYPSMTVRILAQARRRLGHASSSPRSMFHF